MAIPAGHWHPILPAGPDSQDPARARIALAAVAHGQRSPLTDKWRAVSHDEIAVSAGKARLLQIGPWAYVRFLDVIRRTAGFVPRINSPRRGNVGRRQRFRRGPFATDSG